MFKSLHYGEDILVLPNAWDAMSARVFEKMGAKAIGTTSAGIANSLGFPDGERIPKPLFLMMVERIIKSVNLPVTVDLESGYAANLEQLSEIVQQLIALGAVGLNIEDADLNSENSLVDIDLQVKKIKAIRAVAERQNSPFFINARTDVYWLEVGESKNRYEATMQRLRAYQDAGADGFFVPGLTDLAIIKKICDAVSLPVNILGGAWVTSLQALQSCGVKRVSVGSGIFRASAACITNIANQVILSGDFQGLKNAIPYDVMNGLFESDL